MSLVTLFNGQATTGQSAQVGNPARHLLADHIIQATITGSPDAVTLTLQGSVDGITWMNLAEHLATSDELTAGTLMFNVVYKPAPYARLSLDTLSGGTSPTVTAKYAYTTKRV
jgi:hypothetical protein